MSLYVYCPRKSNGALELVTALEAKRLRRFDGMDFWDRRKRFELEEGDAIVCWGAPLPELDGVRVLNCIDKTVDKSMELALIQNAGIPTIRTYQKVPKGTDPTGLIPRVIHHSGGADLLHTPKYPDYYVVKENFVKEYRIHSFEGRSIRAGEKILRDGFDLAPSEAAWKLGMAHPWIRSFDAGWRVNYDGFKSTAKLRRIAHTAVKALGLTFGAVDLGETPQGIIKVLEVNRAPGIENNTVQSYVRAINRWVKGETQPVGEQEAE